MAIGNSVATLTNNAGFISSATNQAIVKPQDFQGIAGFVFDVISRDGVNLNSDITDHFIEDNTVINDHIALKPEVVTVSGLIGELKLESEPLLAPLGSLTDKLNAFSGFLPDLATQANQIYNQAENALNVAKQAGQTAENVFNLFNDLDAAPKETFQAKAFNFFYALWRSRQIFTVENPWNTFTNMSILDMEAIQEDTKYISDFSITFKKLRFAKIIQIENSQGRRSQQISEVQDKGRIKGEEKPQSLLRSLF